MKYLTRFFGSHRIGLIAAALAFLLAVPSLMSDLCMDDYQQRTTLLTNPDGNPFEFYRMGAPETEAMLQKGILPWWTHPDSKLVFFRPIAKWLMQVDYRFWPDNFALMHLHSVLWYVLLVGVIGWVYRRFIPSSVTVGLALIMFAIDGTHGGAVAWLANRNVIVAMIGSMLVLVCYSRDEWSWQLVGCSLLAMTLFCAEAALSITGYLFAYEVFLSKRSWALRVLRLTPYALTAFTWLLWWRYNGFGSSGPGFYTDPHDTQAFLGALTFRPPAYLLGQFLLFPIEILAFSEGSAWQPLVFIVVVSVCVLIARAFWRLLRESAAARFFALGMLIATLPISGSQLVARSLWYVGFGAYGLLAIWLEPFFSTNSAKKITPLAGAMLVLHLAISPLLFLFGEAVFGPILNNITDTRVVNLPNEQGHDRKVLLLWVPQYEFLTYYPLLKDEALALGEIPKRSQPAIAKLRLLTNGSDDFAVERKDADTLLIRREGGFDTMRKGVYGFSRGESMALDDVVVTVNAVSVAGAATEIEYHFAPGVLDDYEVMTWSKKQFVSVQLPAVGEVIQVKTPAAS
ncbi:MAG: hypothetical protein QM709_08015 [Spongiibacteraceae bacterium]